MNVNCAEFLPLRHCAFKRCHWQGNNEDDLTPHAKQEHSSIVEPALQACPWRGSKAERTRALFAKNIRESAPLTSPSIDRSTLRARANALQDNMTCSMICLLCGQKRTYHADAAQQDTSISKSTSASSAEKVSSTICMHFRVECRADKTNFGLDTFLVKYGHCHAEGRNSSNCE